VEDLSENLTQVDLAAAKLSNVVNETQERIQPLPPPPVVFNPDLELDDLRAVAANNRAEMTALNYRMDVAQELLEAAKKSNRPELVLSANYRTAFGQSLSPTNVPSINLQIQWTLFDGGLKKAQIREAESVLQELDASRVSAVNDINLEVEQAWLELLQNRFNLMTAKEQLSNAEEYYEMAMERFIHGLSTALEVSESLRNLIAARSQLVRAEFDRDLAFARLERTLGVDVPDRNLTEEFINTARRRPDSETDSER
jgi:outer membrane protein TolC